MESRESARLSARLLALDLRIHELDRDLTRARVEANRLEARLEDARLARMMGEEHGSVEELGPELEQSRESVRVQEELLATARRSRWEARVAHALLRSRERREQQGAEDAGG